MKKEVISNKQTIILFILFTMGSSFLLGTASVAQRDAWISIIFSVTVSIPIIIMQCKIIKDFPDKNFFEVLEYVLGKYIGKGMILLYSFYSFFIAVLILNIMGEFIKITSLDITPKILPMACIGLLCILAIKAGIEAFSRWSEFFIFIAIPIYFTMIVLNVSQIDLNNIRPILFNGISPVLQGIFAAVGFPFTQAIVFVMLKETLKSSASIVKLCIIGMVIGGGILLVGTLRNTFILGAGALRYYFPTELSESLIQLGDFVQRLESAAIIVYMITGYVKITLCLFAAANGIKALFRLQEYEFLAAPITLLMLYSAYTVFPSVKDEMAWIQEIYPYYGLLFQIILPAFIVLLCIFKGRKRSSMLRKEI